MRAASALSTLFERLHVPGSKAFQLGSFCQKPVYDPRSAMLASFCQKPLSMGPPPLTPRALCGAVDFRATLSAPSIEFANCEFSFRKCTTLVAIERTQSHDQIISLLWIRPFFDPYKNLVSQADG